MAVIESKSGDYLMLRSELRDILAIDLKQALLTRSETLAKQDYGFADELDEIAGLLARHDPAPSPMLQAIDQKGQDLATYFFAAYSDTHNLDKSILVYKTVKSLVRYILLMDRFYEVGNKRYERMAKGLLRSIKQAHEGHHLKYSIDFALKQFWPFWEFEQLIKQRMIKGHTFTAKELRHFNLFKSSDAPIIYACVLDNELPSFNPNVTAIIHYNQALEDIQDDFDDIEEDLLEMLPNVFILASSEHVPYSTLVNNQSKAKRMIIDSGPVDTVLTMVEQYNRLINDIPVPESYAFLKHLAKDYTDRLLRTLENAR